MMRRTIASFSSRLRPGPTPTAGTYVEGAYNRANLDDFDEAADSLWVTGSYEAADWLHLWATAAYSDTEMSEAGIMVELEGSDTSVGVGMHTDVAPAISVFGRAALSRVESRVSVSGGFLGEPGSFTEDDDGVVANAGARLRALPAVEVQATLHLASYDGESDESLCLDARYDMTELLTAVAGVAIHQDAEVFNVGLRVRF